MDIYETWKYETHSLVIIIIWNITATKKYA